MCMVWPFLKMHLCVLKKEVKLINHDFPPILMLLYILLYIMLAYLMLLAVLSNAVCLLNAYFLPLIFANAFCFRGLSWFIDTWFLLFQILFCMMHSAFNLLVFLILCSHRSLHERAMCSLVK